MTDRIIDIADQPAALYVRNEQLVIQFESASEARIPLIDIAVLVVSQPRVTYSQAVLAGIAEMGGMMIVCDAKHLPVAMLLPLAGHSTQAERFAQQAEASLPTRKRLWKQIVQAKIRNQAGCLKEVNGKDAGLEQYAKRVKSGDPQNMEAHASRRYWRALFGREFRRDRDRADQNRFLNYGYAVIRAITARAICAAGLHPSLGLHHHNRYDALCLADDLVEPFRPVVDRSVFRICETWGPGAEFDRGTKAELLGDLTGRFTISKEERTLFDIAARSASSLEGVFAGKRKKLVLLNWSQMGADI